MLSASVEGRGLAPGGGAWRPGAGLREPGSCCLLSATQAGAEGTASGRRAADSQAARGKVKTGERAGGSSCLAAAVQVPERPWSPKLCVGTLGVCIASREGLPSQGFACITAGPGARGFRGLQREPATIPGQSDSETTLRSGPPPSSLYCYCLSASSLTVSPDSSFVLIRPNPRSPRA